MSRALGSAVLGLVCASCAMSWALAVDAPVPPKPPGKVVRLNCAADLERLRDTNFNHYQRAEKIIADGSKLCSPGLPTLQLAAQYGAKDMSCDNLLLTSNPPKKLLEFRLDDTQYIALITITNAEARLFRAR